MNDLELLRYSRHLLLDEIGIAGQERINQSHVLVVGAGGLGSACAPYLAAAGVGTLTIMDYDTVELTNLARQIMHSSASLGLPKVNSAKSMLQALNPLINIHAVQQKADAKTLSEQIPKVDIVVDCTDNFKTRHLINRFCITSKKPLVSGAALQFDGQVSVFNARDDTSACYACLFPEDDAFTEAACATMGVFSPLVGIIGALQAAQVLQLITHSGESLFNQLLLWNGRDSTVTKIQLQRLNSCKVCQPT